MAACGTNVLFLFEVYARFIPSDSGGKLIQNKDNKKCKPGLVANKMKTKPIKNNKVNQGLVAANDIFLARYSPVSTLPSL